MCPQTMMRPASCAAAGRAQLQDERPGDTCLNVKECRSVPVRAIVSMHGIGCKMSPDTVAIRRIQGPQQTIKHLASAGHPGPARGQWRLDIDVDLALNVTQAYTTHRSRSGAIRRGCGASGWLRRDSALRRCMERRTRGLSTSCTGTADRLPTSLETLQVGPGGGNSALQCWSCSASCSVGASLSGARRWRRHCAAIWPECSADAAMRDIPTRASGDLQQRLPSSRGQRACCADASASATGAARLALNPRAAARQDGPGRSAKISTCARSGCKPALPAARCRSVQQSASRGRMLAAECKTGASRNLLLVGTIAQLQYAPQTPGVSVAIVQLRR